MTLLTSL